MDDIKLLYHDVILEHAKDPHGALMLDQPYHEAIQYNPACGDVVRVMIRYHHDLVQDIGCLVKGCAICTASGSMMCQEIQGQTISKAFGLIKSMRRMLLGHAGSEFTNDLNALIGVANYPNRIKCALLPWMALEQLVKTDREIS